MKIPNHTGPLQGAADFLRASHIKRWGIVRTAGTQSVAEHLYRVWTLVHVWGPDAGLSEQEQSLAERWALTHDLPEIRTGDNPTPHKTPAVKEWLSLLEAEICPEASSIEHLIDGPLYDFCKFCDTAEAILYLRVNGLGRHASDVMQLLREQMYARLAASSMPAATQSTLGELFESTFPEA